MRPGKLDPVLLESLLQALTSPATPVPPAHDAELTLGPGLGRDAAVVRLPDRDLVFTADPITFPLSARGTDTEAAARTAGAAAVHVNANDLVCLGADPRWLLATILVPPNTAVSHIAALFDGLAAACHHLGATLIGGHTEVTDAVTRPVISGAMIGDAPHDRLYPSTDVRPGDDLIQIGPVAIEGTALLATAAPDVLRDAGITAAEIDQAAALAHDPGISVVATARAAWGGLGLHSLHDPTEGGIATACREMAASGSSRTHERPAASPLRVEIDDAALLVHPLTHRIAAALGLDWRGLLASGALLAAVDAAHTDAFLQRLRVAGHLAARIGRFSPLGAANSEGDHSETAILRGPEGTRALPYFARDEALRVLTPDA